MVQSCYLDKRVADAQNQRHPYRMAKEGGFRRKMTAQAQPHIAETVETVVGKLVVGVIARHCHRLFRLNGGELSIDGSQVVEQESQGFELFRRCPTGLNAIEGRIQMTECAFKARIVLIGRSSIERASCWQA